MLHERWPYVRLLSEMKDHSTHMPSRVNDCLGGSPIMSMSNESYDQYDCKNHNQILQNSSP